MLTRVGTALLCGLAIAGAGVGTAATAAASTVYTADAGSNSITGLPVLATGKLGTPTQTGSGAPSGSEPDALAYSPYGNGLFVADGAGVFSDFVPSADGSLLAATNPLISDNGSPLDIAVSPDGHNIYTVDPVLEDISTYQLGADGSVSPLHNPPALPTSGGGSAIAVAPNGDAVYVADTTDSEITQYSRATDGTLSLMSQATVSTGTGSEPDALALAPNGGALYVADAKGVIDVMPIGPAGALAGVTTSVAAGTSPDSLAISPDGANLYVGNRMDNDVGAYAISGTAAPAPLSTPTVSLPAHPLGLTVSPDGTKVYVAVSDAYVAAFTRGSGGELTSAGDTQTGSGVDPTGITETPDSGPAAAFTATTATVGTATSFDASGSTAGTAPIASYTWSFGDGQTATGPSPSHAYAAAGTYTVTLTETDADLCGASGPWTGQTPTCLLDGAATVSHQVTVNPAPAQTTTTTTTGPPGGTVPTGPPLATLTLGGTTLTLAGADARSCIAPGGRFGVTLSQSRKRTGTAFTSAAFYLDRGVAHTHTVTRHGKRVKVTRYTANATAHKLPATVTLSVRGLKAGDHQLRVVVTFVESRTVKVKTHGKVRKEGRLVKVTRTMRVPIRIC